MASEELLESPPPATTASEASEITASLFGIVGSAVALDGERDANFRIDTEAGSFSLKIANPAERPTVIEMQQLALEHIAGTDPILSVPRTVRTSEGSLVGSADVGGRESPVRLLTFLAGTAIPDGFSTTLLRRRLGSLAARLDLALHGFEHPELSREYLWDIRQMTGIRTHAHHLDDIRFDFVSSLLDKFHREIGPRLAGLPAQVIHSDLNPENLLVDPTDPESVIGVIDFADVIRSPRIFDPSVAAAYQCFGATDPTEVLVDIISAYHQITPLSRAEIGLAPDLVTARLVQSLVIGAWRADIHPDNRDYILIHAEPAWEALVNLEQIGVGALRESVRDACKVV